MLCYFQVDPPLKLITSMEVPSTNNIQFHGIETVTNLQDTDLKGAKTPKFEIAEIPFTIQVDDIKSLFLQVG